jgi:hypothetical protein
MVLMPLLCLGDLATGHLQRSGWKNQSAERMTISPSNPPISGLIMSRHVGVQVRRFPPADVFIARSS